MPVEVTAQTVREAELLLQAGQLAEARRVLEKVLLADPTDAHAKALLIEHNLAPAWKLKEWQEQDRYHYFVDESIREYHGDAAARKLAEKNDSRFLSGHGIVQVDAGRWAEAQRYERKTWLEQNLAASDDRNEFHKAQFDGYKSIAGRRFENVIELGCGPFTNLRLVLPLIQAHGVVDLLDPLIDGYLTHPHCTYANRKLLGRDVRTYASPIETFAPDAQYDLVVMINVLEHCYDIPQIFRNISGMLRTGGTFVFADVTTTPEALRATKTYDAGHPIRMLDEYLTGVLSAGFTTLFHNQFRDVSHLQHRDICHYFVGTKKA